MKTKRREITNVQYKLDPMLPGGINENDPYFTEGDETFDDGVPREVNAEGVKRDPADVEALLREIESRMPDDVLELFAERKKSKKEEAA